MVESETGPTILLSADVRYARPLAVALASTLEHVVSGTRVALALDDFGRRERAVLEHIAAGRDDVQVAILDGATFDREGLTGPRHLTRATYLRLFLDRIFPAARRVLYLDADVMVRQPLAPLFGVDLEGRTVAAVRDMAIHDHAHPLVHPAFVDPAGAGDPFFNSGVLVVDVGRWRELEVGQRVLALVRRHGTGDQVALNEVLRGDWRELEPTWNVQGSLLLLHEHRPHKRRDELQARQAELLRDPAIVHFSGIKPWRAASRHPFAAEWRRAARRAHPPRRRRWELELLARRAARGALEAFHLRETRERVAPR